MTGQPNLGAEIRRSTIPQKYMTNSSLIGDIIPTAIAFLLVELYSGTLLSGTMGAVMSFVISLIIYCIFMTIMYFVFKAMRKKQAQTYITVCEYGIYGTCARGMNLCNYVVPYSDIKSVSGKRETLRITSASCGSIIHMLPDAPEIATLIQSRMQALSAGVNVNG